MRLDFFTGYADPAVPVGGSTVAIHRHYWQTQCHHRGLLPAERGFRKRKRFGTYDLVIFKKFTTAPLPPF